MAKWTPEEDACLKECAKTGLTAGEAAVAVAALGNERGEAACASRARRLKITFNSASNIGLRNFLAEGGRLIREDIGGVIGVRWARAHRSGSGFATDVCEKLLAIGLLKPEPNAQHVYRASR